MEIVTYKVSNMTANYLTLENLGLQNAELTNATDTAAESGLDLPSFFVPDALRESITAVGENFFCTGELPEYLVEGATANLATGSFFEETPPSEPYFYTGIRGYGFRCYFYHWFYQSKDLAISIVLPYPGVLVDEEKHQELWDEIRHANDMAALLVAAVEKHPALLEHHPEARLRLTWDQRGFSYGFYQDGHQLEVSQTPDMLTEILNNIFPADLLHHMTMIRP